MMPGTHECVPYGGTGDALFIAPGYESVGAPFMAPWRQSGTMHKRCQGRMNAPLRATLDMQGRHLWRPDNRQRPGGISV